MSIRVTDDFAGSGALSGSWTVSEGTFSRTSGEAGPSADAVNVALYTGDSPPNDQYATVVLGSNVSTISDEGIGPVVRGTASGNMYFAQSNTSETRIYKRVSGTFTQVGTDGAAGATGDSITLEVSGTSLTCKKNGTAIIGPVTDTSIASGTTYGMWDSKQFATANTTSFEGGDFAGSPAPGAGRINFTGFAPSIATSGSFTVTPGKGTIVFTGKAPQLKSVPSIPYITSFPLTENPMSEGNVWYQGFTDGVSWTDVKTASGFAQATQTVHAPPPYDDSIACLNSFPADQYASAVLHSSGVSGEREVELLLRWQITANNARGYEVDILANGNVYIVRWNGALNNFDILSGPTASTVNDGDKFYAIIVGTLITVRRNGATVVTYDTSGDTTKWSTGDPGVGFYTDNSLGAPSASDTFAWDSFEAGVPTLITPSPGTIVFTGKAPTVSTPVSITPSQGNIVFTGQAPTLSGTSVTVTTNLGTIFFTGYAPIVSGGTEIVTTTPIPGVRSRNRRLRVLPDRRIVLADEYETEQLLKLFKVEDIEEITQVPPRKYKKLRDKALPAPDIIAQMQEEEDVLYVMKEIARLL